MREASETGIFKFLHRHVCEAIAAGDASAAWASSFLLGHYARAWESERVKRGRWGGSVARFDVHHDAMGEN